MRFFKDWLIVILCALLIMTNFLPQAIEWVYPIQDLKGANLMNMETEKNLYFCGETPRALWISQKQREAVGSMKWSLVDGPETETYYYPPKTVASPIGIYKHWVAVEPLPTVCKPGKYHFEGTITYPVLFGSVTYQLRTQCFEVRVK